MNTSTTMDEYSPSAIQHVGEALSSIRQKNGYSTDYVASKLRLRVHVIELIEAGDFSLLPEPVFIRGYLRAYSKLLGISPDPYINAYNADHAEDKKPERALWQSKRESYKAERFIRWFTLLCAFAVLVAVGLWWEKNKDSQVHLSAKKESLALSFGDSGYTESALPESASGELAVAVPELPSGLEHDLMPEVKLTDLSKMQALLNPSLPLSPMEKQGG